MKRLIVCVFAVFVLSPIFFATCCIVSTLSAIKLSFFKVWDEFTYPIIKELTQ
jgi:hypothetical protein